MLAPIGLSGPGYSDVAVWLVESYLWLPYMIIPIYAGLERIPTSLLEASSDLGGRVVDHAPPGDPAAGPACDRRGLDLHVQPDPRRLHHADTRLEHEVIGNVVYDFMGIAGNQPFAAAYAMVPVTIMLVYLLIARRLGAFEAL